MSICHKFVTSVDQLSWRHKVCHNLEGNRLWQFWVDLSDEQLIFVTELYCPMKNVTKQTAVTTNSSDVTRYSSQKVIFVVVGTWTSKITPVFSALPQQMSPWSIVSFTAHSQRHVGQQLVFKWGMMSLFATLEQLKQQLGVPFFMEIIIFMSLGCIWMQWNDFIFKGIHPSHDACFQHFKKEFALVICWCLLCSIWIDIL